MTTIQLKPAIAKTQHGWEMTATLGKCLQLLTRERGILKYELYEATLKEYKKHQGVYDHLNPMVLCHRAYRLAQECKHRTRTEVSDTHIFRSYIQELGGITTPTLAPYQFPNTIRFTWEPHNWEHFPIMPKEGMRVLATILYQIAPLISIQGRARSAVDLHKDFIVPAMERYIVYFYEDWETHARNPEKWLNRCLELCIRQNFVTDHASKKAKSIVIESMNHAIQHEDFSMPEFQEKRWYHWLLNIIGL